MVITGGALSIADVVSVARQDALVAIAPEADRLMLDARAIIERLAAGDRPAYGISTGFGALATRHIDVARRETLQRSLVRSHAAGMGPSVEREVVRALMLLRLRTLCTGHTGVRPVVAHTLAALLNAGITPEVPEYGSLGCSGDLAPLAHVALALIGEGPSAPALVEAGITPVTLQAKEGLALINGTDGMLGQLCLALADTAIAIDTADVTAALSVEALLGTDQVFREALMALRPHPGQAVSAAHMRHVLAGSPIVASHREGDVRVQDAYSLRCAPQVNGAARDTATFATQVADRELASAIDNPAVLDSGEVSSNGNFHGAPLGYVLDFLAIALTDVSSMSERRTDRLLDASRSHGLPPFLAADPGVDSGLMIAQYTQAGLVSENKRLAAPASVDSIPSSAMQEDHVSMGWAAARKLRRVIDNTMRVVAVEYVAAARALELRAPLKPSPVSARLIALLRERVAGPGPDRYLAPELAATEALVRAGAVADEALRR